MPKVCLISYIIFFAGFVCSLEVAVNSPCAKRCLDDPKTGDPAKTGDSLTFNPDLSCLDSEYIRKNATTVGTKFSDCQNCMMTSGYEDQGTGERDTGWFLFNNRGTVDWCLFGRFAEETNPKVSTTYPYNQCHSKCQAIYDASDYRIKSDPQKYDYCDTSGDFITNAKDCVNCLYSSQNLTILGNILSSLQEMCVSKPGKAINFNANLYTTTRVTFATSSTSSSSSSVNSSTSSPSASSSTSAAASSKSGISAGTIGGIVVGSLVGVAGLLGGVLFFLRRAHNKKKIAEMSLKGNEAGVAGGTYGTGYSYDPVPQQKDVYAYGTPMGFSAQTYGAPPSPYVPPQPYDPAAPVETGRQNIAELGLDERRQAPAEMASTSPTARTGPTELGPSSPTGMPANSMEQRREGDTERGRTNLNSQR